VDGTAVTHLVLPGFRSLLTNWLSWLRFLVLLSPSRQIVGSRCVIPWLLPSIPLPIHDSLIILSLDTVLIISEKNWMREWVTYILSGYEYKLARFEVLTVVSLVCRSSGMWYCVEGQVVREVLKDHNAFIFRIKLSEQNSFLPSNAASHSRRCESYVTSHL